MQVADEVSLLRLLTKQVVLKYILGLYCGGRKSEWNRLTKERQQWRNKEECLLYVGVTG